MMFRPGPLWVTEAVFSEPRRRASRLGFSIMFELFQVVADCSVARSICVSRRRRFQRCIFLSRDVRECGCDGAQQRGGGRARGVRA
jgi:hypothetical protein